MSEYIIKCMPYIDQHIEDGGENSNTDNVFNVKETVGLKRKDIFTDYLIDVENKTFIDHVNEQLKDVRRVQIVTSFIFIVQVISCVIHVV